MMEKYDYQSVFQVYDHLHPMTKRLLHEKLSDRVIKTLQKGDVLDD